MALKNIEDAIFRANPHYELVLLDRLPAVEQTKLGELRADPDIYGVLRPREEGGLEVRTVDRDIALLYHTLREAGPLPLYVRHILGAEYSTTIRTMVLDGVLEISGGGEFVTGATAAPILSEAIELTTPSGILARLSLDALRYADALDLPDSRQTSVRLYNYNRHPASPVWKQQWPTSEAVAAYLNLKDKSLTAKLLRQNWINVSTGAGHGAWWVWLPRRDAAPPPTNQPTYKLYVSPACAYVREAFAIALNIFTETGVRCFKVGNDLYGLLRPDKLIAYFTDFEELQATATRLHQVLAECPAHGVPFTADLAGDGLLSWGIDPPTPQPERRWQPRESWRLWLTNRLASALHTARATPTPMLPPWQFAQERLQLDGVDPTTWTPTPRWTAFDVTEA